MQTESTLVAGSPPIPLSTDGLLLPLLERVRALEEACHLPFLLVDGDAGVVRGHGETEVPGYLPEVLRNRLSERGEPVVVETTEDVVHVAVRLEDLAPVPHYAVGCALRRGDVRPAGLVRAAAEENWDGRRFDAFLAKLPVVSAELLEKLVRLALERLQFDEEVESLGYEMQRTYEELALLHSVTRRLQISRSPEEIARLCLDRVHVLCRGEGTGVWIESSPGAHEFLIRGRLPLDELGFAHLLARYEDHDWRIPLVRNDARETRVSSLASELRSFVTVPIAEGEHRFGWIVTCNAVDREFGTEEASLLATVATMLGTHVRNIELYREHEALLVGFVQSMVSTLDAKDPYTRGHSERVAAIARRLAIELDLPAKDVEAIHLSGVLHDVGKVGVDDRVLRKDGKLTAEEFEHVKQHPLIGYNILSGIDNLRHVLPGVRNHHENWDGTGYPDGLAGREIPLMARIIAVADAFDAMGSDRPYRRGMPIEKVESILRAGAGKQWDVDVVDAYFRVRDDVRLLSERFLADGLRDDGGTSPAE